MPLQLGMSHLQHAAGWAQAHTDYMQLLPRHVQTGYMPIVLHCDHIVQGHISALHGYVRVLHGYARVRVHLLHSCARVHGCGHVAPHVCQGGGQSFAGCRWSGTNLHSCASDWWKEQRGLGHMPAQGRSQEVAYTCRIAQ